MINAKRKVYVLGSVNEDMDIFAPRWPKIGETMTGDSFMMARGGKGANQAIAISRSGGSAVFIGAVGDDAFGRESRQALIDDGVDVTHLRTTSETSTGMAVITVSNGDNSIILVPGANLSMTPKDVQDGLVDARPGDFFLTQFENKLEDAMFGLRYAHNKGLITALNPSPMKEFSLSALRYVDYLIVNEIETEALCGILPESLDDAQTAFNLMRRYGLSHLILTIGGGGSLYVDGSNSYVVKALKITPVDTTGAGDTYLGSLLARLSLNDPLFDALKYASAASSLACLKKGAQPSIPYTDEVRQHIRELD